MIERLQLKPETFSAKNQAFTKIGNFLNLCKTCSSRRAYPKWAGSMHHVYTSMEMFHVHALGYIWN